MKTKQKRKGLVGLLLVAVMLCALIIPAGPALAYGTATLSINPSGTNVDAGDSFSVDVLVTTTDTTVGAQMELHFDPAVVQITGVTEGAFYSSGGSYFATTDILDANTTGVLYGISCTALGWSQPAGNGTFMTIAMSAVADGYTDLELIDLTGTPDTYVLDGDSAYVDETNLTLNNGSVQVGTPLPDLQVTDIDVSWVSATEYDVTYTITNAGLGDAGAFDTELEIDSVLYDTYNHTGLTAGNSEPVTVSSITVSGESDDILVTTDSGAAVTESDETNNTGTASTAAISVDLRVTGIDGDIINVADYEVPVGTVLEDTFTIDTQTAMGALVHYCQANSIEVDILEWTGFGYYIYQIGTDGDDENSWMYAVDGVGPWVSAADYGLAGGEFVHFYNYALGFYNTSGSGDTIVHGLGVAELEITVPDNILTGWDLFVGEDNETGGTLNIKSNADWEVTVQDTSDYSDPGDPDTGYMTQYDIEGTAYGTTSLENGFHVVGDNNVNIADGLGIVADSSSHPQGDGNTGAAVTITFQQYVEYDDPVPTGNFDVYRIVVTFTAYQTIS